MFQTIVDCIFTPVYREGESSTERLRKTIVLLIGIANPIPCFCIGGYWLYVASGGAPGSSGALFYLAGIYLCFFGIMTVVSLIVARWRRNVTNLHYNLFIGMFELLGVVFMLGLPSTQAVLLLSGCLQVVHLATQSDFLVPRLLYLLGLAIWQTAAIAYPRTFAIPTQRQAIDGTEYFLYLLCAWIICQPSVSIGGVYFLVKVNNQQFAKAEAAVKLAHSIVDLLRDYDTDGVKLELENQERLANVDPKLISSLKSMTKNLEEYRPFLPNYVFLKQAADSGSTEDVQMTPRAPPQIRSYLQQQMTSFQQRKPSTPGTSSLRKYQPDSYSSDLDGAGNSKTSPPGSKKASLFNTSSQSEFDDAKSIKSDHSIASHESPLNLSMSGHFHLASGAHQRYSGPVALAQLDCRTAFADGMTSEKMTAFVNHLFGVASGTNAAVHCLVGDTATISWNATHRVHQPHHCAALFLAKLRKVLSATSGLVLSAAATVERDVQCHTLVSSTKQHVLMVEMNETAALEAAYALARRYGTTIVTEAIQAVAKSEVSFLPVDRVEFTVGVPGSATLWCDVTSDLKEPEQQHTSPSLSIPGFSSSILNVAQAAAGGSRSAVHAKKRRRLFEIVDLVDRLDDIWMYSLESQPGEAQQERRDSGGDGGRKSSLGLAGAKSDVFDHVIDLADEGEIGAALDILLRSDERVKVNQSTPSTGSSPSSQLGVQQTPLLMRLRNHLESLLTAQVMNPRR